jgi:DNA-directed RNA polymerase specialized sigma24 family protein
MNASQFGTAKSLFYSHLESYQDIAKLFGKTESWARVTFHRAKLKIIEQVKEESYE